MHVDHTISQHVIDVMLSNQGNAFLVTSLVLEESTGDRQGYALKDKVLWFNPVTVRFYTNWGHFHE